MMLSRAKLQDHSTICYIETSTHDRRKLQLKASWQVNRVLPICKALLACQTYQPLSSNDQENSTHGKPY